MTITPNIGVWLLVSAGVLAAAPLQQETLNAWDTYVRMVEARTRARLEPARSFLWIDEDPERRRLVRNGGVVVSPSRDQALQTVPRGLIHDWIAGMFIPGVSIQDVLAVLRNYDRYQEIFTPTVVASKDFGRKSDSQAFTMRWIRKVLVLTAGVEGSFESRDFQVNPNSWYGLSYSTRLQEIEGYGRASERTYPADQGPGYIWRVYSVTRYEQRDGGVYLEMEGLALTRDIPASMRWLVKPVVEKLSKSALTTSFEQTRAAVRAYRQSLIRSAELLKENREEIPGTR